MLNRDDILALYASGSEAVLTVIDQLQQQVSGLTARVSELEQRLKQDSHNSHKPPSSDGLAKKPAPRSQRTVSGKRAGAQPGHRGQTRALSDTPDQIIAHSPPHCAQCQSVLTTIPAESYERRQVLELPPLKCQVIEHRAERKTCPHCQTRTQAPFPTTVSQPVQYGEHCKAVLVYLQSYQLLPYDRTCELFHDLFELTPAAGTLEQALVTCHTALAPVEAQIRATLVQEAVAHFDETGIRIGGQTHWLHSASTPTLTFYAHHRKRGRVAMEAISPLTQCSGIAVHDALAAYLSYPCTHALCNAHLLRELTALSEQGQGWATDLRGLLLDSKQAVTHAQTQGLRAVSEPERQAFEQRYTQALSTGQQANPPAPPTGQRGRTKQSVAYNLLKRLTTYREAVLRFLHDFRVPFDNNLAERDLRMVKLRQKISGCFRSTDGASIFCRLRGYVSTLRKQGLPILPALRSAIAGQPLVPQLR
jgi:transposase